MRIWKGFLTLSIRFSFPVLLVLCTASRGSAQSFSHQSATSPRQNSYFALMLQESQPAKLLSPKDVMRRSLIVPGWGQITNKQAWKVPIVYGLLGGLSYYTIYLTKEYHQFRAAYYNSFPENTDFRFGPTPPALVGQSASFLKNQRDFLRNRRDFIYITIALSYLLHVVDAYVFAHLRSFDVSDDLSFNTSVAPLTTAAGGGLTPAVKLTIKLK